MMQSFWDKEEERETVKTLEDAGWVANTLLKQGVNETPGATKFAIKFTRKVFCNAANAGSPLRGVYQPTMAPMPD